MLLLVAFLGWTQGMSWLFYGALVVIVIFSKSIGVAFLITTGVIAMYLLHLQEYWYVILIGIAVVLILGAALKKEGGGQEGMYSPELMQMLMQGQGGGGGYQ